MGVQLKTPQNTYCRKNTKQKASNTLRTAPGGRLNFGALIPSARISWRRASHTADSGVFQATKERITTGRVPIRYRMRHARARLPPC